MLSCREVAEHADLWVSGEAAWRLRASVRLHLLLCGLCRRYLDQYEKTVAALRDLSSEPVPTAIDSAARAAFEAAFPARGP